MANQTHHIGWMGWIAIGSASLAAILILYYLIKRPPLTASIKVMLLAALGGLPIVSAASVNVQGFQSMQSRHFCGSCHVMKPYEDASDDIGDHALAPIHARNEHFGNDNCYMCHKDYGMYGFALTKMGGMRHVYYYLTEYRSMSLDESLHSIHILRPLPNDNCMSCHSTFGPRWQAVPDHAASLELVRRDEVSCASAGCHGYAHPMSKSRASQPGVEGVQP